MANITLFERNRSNSKHEEKNILLETIKQERFIKMATRYIGLKEMCQLTGKSHPTLWRMWAKKKDFPAPQKSRSGTFLGWPEKEYEEWVEVQRVNSTR